MSDLILCIGEYAKNPYFVPDDCIDLFSIEELCYYLFTNAYLLDDRFVSKELAEWITGELELKEIGKQVHRMAGRPDALSKLVILMRDDIGLYDASEWDELLSEIGRNNKLSLEERRKVRADSFLNDGKYMLAIDEYLMLLNETGPAQVKLRAKVYHNLGICSVRLFMFERAAGYFEKAYNTYANTESYVSMLGAKKMSLSSEEYLAYLSEHKDSYEDSLEVERKLETLKLGWSSRPTRYYINELKDMKQQGKAYYDGIGAMTSRIKDDYRNCVYRNK
jgi:tetratricopeptide (TPR) repeat protein